MSGSAQNPSTNRPWVSAYARAVIEESHDQQPGEDLVRVQLSLYADGSPRVVGWTDLPVNIVDFVDNHTEEVMAEVKIFHHNGKFIYKEVRFPVNVNGVRYEWFALKLEER